MAIWYSAPRFARAAWRAGAATELFRGRYFQTGDGTLARQYDIDSDGRFLMLEEATGPGEIPPHSVVVQNWQEELKQRQP